MTPPPDPEYAPRITRPTRRQLEVLALVAAGKTFVQIADVLGIGLQTVKNHSDGAKRHLKASNLPQAVAECIVRGWLVANRRA